MHLPVETFKHTFSKIKLTYKKSFIRLCKVGSDGEIDLSQSHGAVPAK